MNCCTELREILLGHVLRQFLEPQWISRSQVKGQGNRTRFWGKNPC